MENDGYDLGAQRQPIEGNELQQVRDEIVAYLQRLRVGEARRDIQTEPTALAAESRAEYVTDGSRTTDGLIVEKVRVAADGEYNLSRERYRIVSVRSSSWPIVPVGEVFERSVETVLPKTLSGAINYVGLENISQNTSRLVGKTVNSDPASIKSLKNSFGPNEILYGKLRPNLNKVWLSDRNGICSTDIFVITPKVDKVEPTLYSHIFRDRRFNDQVMSQVKGAQLPRIGWKSFADIGIPLPPLEVQQEIVAEIEGYQKVIDGARAVVENYRPHIHVDPDWPMVKLGELVENVLIGLVRSKADQNPTFPYKYLKMNNITRKGTLELEKISYVNATPEELKRYALRDGDYLYNTRNSPDLVGKSAVFHGKSDSFVFNNNILRMRFCPVTIPDFVNLVMNSEFGKARIRALVDGTTSVAALYQKNYLAIEIPLPTLQTQRAVVAEIQTEQSLVGANRELIERFEKKIENVIAGVWNE